MDLQTWLVYLLATTGLSLSPGPNSLLALTHGALHGWRRTLFTIAGGALGFVVLIAVFPNIVLWFPNLVLSK